MTAEMAYVGRKDCGCPVFARLTSVKRGTPLEKATKGLDVRRVPVDQAAVVICTCAQ